MTTDLVAEKQLLTSKEARLFLGISGPTMTNLLKTGVIHWEVEPYDKRKRLIRRTDLEVLKRIDGLYLAEARAYLNGVSEAKFHQFIKFGILPVQMDIKHRRYIKLTDLDRLKQESPHLLPSPPPT